MKKIILPLTILCFFICAGQSMATVSMGMGNRTEYYYPNNQASATGKVTVAGRDFIEIYNEDQKREERYTDLSAAQEFQKGNYIRIFYNPYTGVVILIKRMPVLPYNAHSQNLGYISKD